MYRLISAFFAAKALFVTVDSALNHERRSTFVAGFHLTLSFELRLSESLLKISQLETLAIPSHVFAEYPLVHCKYSH